MSATKSTAKVLGASVLVAALAGAAGTAAVLSLRAPSPSPPVTSPAVVYVPVPVLGGAPDESLPPDAPGSAVSLTSADVPSARETPVSVEETGASPGSGQADGVELRPAEPGESLASVLEGARARLAVVGAVALASIPEPLVSSPAVTSVSPAADPTIATAEQDAAAPAAEVAAVAAPAPVVGAGAFQTAAPFYGASAWVSNPEAGAGAFSPPTPPTPQSGIPTGVDPALGAGAFATEWHVPTFVLYPY